MTKKHVYLIHGWGGNPKHGWFPWLKKELENENFDVFAPVMPNTDNPKLETWLPHLSETIGTPDENCYLVGHSLGCITILRYLESLENDKKIGGVILIAGFGKDLEYKDYKGELSSFFETPVDWNKIKKHCPKFIAIHSDNDPWVNIKNGELFKQKLNAKLEIMHAMKHFSGDDGIEKLPIALKSILELDR